MFPSINTKINTIDYLSSCSKFSAQLPYGPTSELRRQRLTNVDDKVWAVGETQATGQSPEE